MMRRVSLIAYIAEAQLLSAGLLFYNIDEQSNPAGS